MLVTNALSPPATMKRTRSLGQAKVGISSAPSWTATRPEVPAPTYTIRPRSPREVLAASVAAVIAGRAWPIAATAASWPSHMASIADVSDHASRSAKRGSTSSVAISVIHAPLKRGTLTLVHGRFLSWAGQAALAPAVTRPPRRRRQDASGVREGQASARAQWHPRAHPPVRA